MPLQCCTDVANPIHSKHFTLQLNPNTMAAKKSVRSTKGGADAGFTAEEREAMRERARELKAERSRAEGASVEGEVLAKIAAMPAADRAMAERVHAIIMAAVPDLAPRLWYGMPAYSKDGKTICFFQDANKFKARYATLGFSDKAMLDEGDMWPTSFALKKITPAIEKRISELVKQAAR